MYIHQYTKTFGGQGYVDDISVSRFQRKSFFFVKRTSIDCRLNCAEVDQI